MALSPSAGFPYYISLVSGLDIGTVFKSEENLLLLSSIDETTSTYRYESGKWSIKQVLGHITDHERIMGYRAMRISRKDQTILPGYDQDLLVENGRFDERSWKELVQDYKNVRQATLSLIESFSKEQLEYKGFVWKYELPVLDILKATIGHEVHHVQVLKEKYIKMT
jgi:uncharacterized damage-inducible protein DinB